MSAERFSLLMSSEYENSLSGFTTDAATLFKFSQLLQDGRCHSIATQFAAQPLHTSIQLSKSGGELSLEKMAINSSGGKHPMGGSGSMRLLSTSRSRKFEPTED